MVAVAASPTPGAARSTSFPSRSHEHPPYKDMILSAIEALKDRKGSSRHAISKYISENYSHLPPSHSTLLNNHLRRLSSNGVIQMFKHSYKIADAPSLGNSGADLGTKKRGRPRKIAQPSDDTAPKKRGRGRPPKLGADASQMDDRAADQLPEIQTPAVVDSAAVYILPQAEQLKSGFLQTLPGALAIVLPEGLLSKKTAKSPVLILPNGVQFLADVSSGKKKKPGRPRKVDLYKNLDQSTDAGVQKSCNGESKGDDAVNIIARKPGRPRKVRTLELSENVQSDSFTVEKLAAAKIKYGALPVTSKGFRPMQNAPSPVLKKPVGRPKKNVVVEGLSSPLATTSNAS